MVKQTSSFGQRHEYVIGDMLDGAAEYYEWTTKKMSTHIHGEVVEIGCGSGGATPYIAKLPCVESLTAIDIDPVAIEKLRQKNIPNVIARQTDFYNLEANSYDAIVCSNVIEHIEDDKEAVEKMQEILKPGGRLALLVPAHQWLYSAYDYDAGHYRRYSKASFQKIIESSDIQIDRIFYFNAIGAIGWLLINTTFCRKKSSAEGFRWSAKIFARWILPLTKILESKISPPIGLSVVCLATKKN